MPPSTPDFGPQIDPYSRFEGQRDCDPLAKPGTAAFRALVLDAYPGTRDMGISRECRRGGPSEHKEGRAWDWGVDVHSQGHIASELIDWLLATDRHGNPHALARRFGIMYVIWNRRIWEAYRHDAGWTPYTGDNPHTDHVHFSFNWAGARKETTWWTTSPWTPRVSVGVPSVVDHGSGMVVFGVDGAGGVIHRWQNAPGGAWSEWTSLGRPAGAAVGRPWALVGRYGKLVVFVRGDDGALWHTWQSEAGEWAPSWVSLGGRLASDPAVVLSPNGALSVFARDPGGRVTHTWQRGPEHGHAWNDSWVDMEGAVEGRPTVLVGRDGGMVLFARGADGGLHHRWQTGTGGPWSGWTPLHGHLTSDPAVVLNPSGDLSVFGRAPDGHLTHTWQRGPEHGHAWNDNWVDMQGDLAPDPAATTRVASARPCHVPPDRDLEVTKAVYIVGRDLKVSDKVMLAGFEAGWVESHMNNLPCGDLDSLGVFQQRPSQGWGTPQQIMHVPYAAEQFFVRAVRVEQKFPHLSAGLTAQEVQRSAFPARYDQAEPKARELLREARAAVGTPPRWASRVSVGVPSVVDHGSGMVVFGVDGAGGVIHRWQNAPGGAWSEWTSLGRPAGAAVGRPWALVGRYGKLVVFARGDDGALWHTWQSEAGEWAPNWVSLHGRLASDPGVVLSPNGALSVFARDLEGRITHTWQRGPEHGHAWNDAWVDMEGAMEGRPTVLVGRDGGMVLFARGADGGLHHRWQTGTGGPWSAWTPLHGHLTTDPAVVLNPSGDLSVFGRAPDGHLTHTWQRGPEHGHAWNDTWVDMQGDLAPDTDGRSAPAGAVR